MAVQQRLQIGKLLVDNHIITPEQLQVVLTEQEKNNGKLGELLIEKGILTEKEFFNFLAIQLNIPFVDLKKQLINPELVQLLPEQYARRNRAIILKSIQYSGYLVGMADPQDIYAVDEITKILHAPVQLALVAENDLLQVIDLAYRNANQITSLAEELSAELQETNIDIKQLSDSAAEEDTPVIKLLLSIFEDAIKFGASDIHIEPEEKILRIRMRIDGVLQEQLLEESLIAPALIQRLKLMAFLNIAERRLPQDGRFSLKVKDRSYDVRLSTLPVAWGEAVVMRILNNSVSTLKLDELGLPKDMLATLRHSMHLSNGMILVTGPTGSGKTTTLYSMLNELNSSRNKIITVEDPIEYRLPRINQVQVNQKIDLTFAKILRTILRHDPDIIMVGEIRDKETNSIALRAAITGHLVLATVHTNDAISTAVRLMDLESEGYLIAEALKVVIAQRLVRRICKECANSHELSASETLWLQQMGVKNPEQAKFKQGKGCSQCNNTGYKGRIGIFELLEFDESMKQALRKDDTQTFVKIAKQKKFKTLAESALELAEQGLTTLAEASIVSFVNEEDYLN